MDKKRLMETIMNNVKKSLNEMSAMPENGVKVGDTIRIIYVDDCNGKDLAATRLIGKEGVVEHIDSMGQLHGTWGGLAIIPEADEFEIIG